MRKKEEPQQPLQDSTDLPQAHLRKDGVVEIKVPDLPSRDRRLLITAIVVACIGVILNAGGLLGLYWIDQVRETTANEERSVRAHRVRNELYHDCLDRNQHDLAEGVNAIIRREATEIRLSNNCPEPLTEEEINTGTLEHEHEE